MGQIEMLHPITTSVTNHRVVISDKVFSEIIEVINKQTEVINSLIEKTSNNQNAIKTLDNSLKDLATAINKL